MSVITIVSRTNDGVLSTNISSVYLKKSEHSKYFNLVGTWDIVDKEIVILQDLSFKQDCKLAKYLSFKLSLNSKENVEVDKLSAKFLTLHERLYLKFNKLFKRN